MIRNDVSFSGNLVLGCCMTVGVSYLAHHMAQQVCFKMSHNSASLSRYFDRPIALALIRRGKLLILIYDRSLEIPGTTEPLSRVLTRFHEMKLGSFFSASSFYGNYIMAIANAGMNKTSRSQRGAYAGILVFEFALRFNQ